MHRKNIAGETKINHLIYNELKHTLTTKDTDYIMTHIAGIDFNSLYPSSFSGVSHEFIKYTGGKMYMPGAVIDYIKCDFKEAKQYAMKIINENKFIENPMLFTVELSGGIPRKYWNEFVNFPPIFRNINIKQDAETIGNYMYDYMVDKNIPNGKSVKKLTQVLEINSMVISSYYLWFLIDRCHFEIKDITEIVTYNSHTAFNTFVTEFMNLRQEAIINKNKGKDLFYKTYLNGSYGYDGMNTEKFNKLAIKTKEQTFKAQLSNEFQSTRKLCDEIENERVAKYQVCYDPKTYDCKTCLQESIFTLDNAKYWYLVFYYDFFVKAFDMDRIHVTHLDTDSCYFAIAGNPLLDSSQLFDYVINDQKFYDENIYKFLPNPKIKTIADEKKLLGCCVEKTYTSLIALAPKCYSGFDVKDDKQTIKMKGVDPRKNEMFFNTNLNVLDNMSVEKGIHTGLQMKSDGVYGKMVQVSLEKNALTAAHTKMYCFPNHSCATLISGCKYVME